MPRIADPKCPNCHASLPVNPNATVLKCQYCGNEVMVKKTHYHQAQPPAQQGPPMNVRDAVNLAHQLGNVKPFKVNPIIIILPIVAILGGVGFAVYMGIKQQRKVQRKVANIQKAATDPEKVSWVTYGRPVVADVNGDDVSDLVVLGTFYNDDQKVYMVAVDGATQKRLWKQGDFGDISNDNANTRTKFMTIGSEIVLVESKANAKIYDLKTGRELRSVALSDKADYFCRYPDDDKKVWIEVSDKNHVDLDIATAQISPAPNRPPGCPTWSNRNDCPEAASAQCVPKHDDKHNQQVAKPEGMYVQFALRDGDNLVAFGYKQPGTGYPMLAGISSNGKKVAWKRRVVEDVNRTVSTSQQNEQSDIVNGVAYTIYEEADEYHLIAVTAADGKTVWDIVLPMQDTTIPPDPEALMASQNRLFVLDHQVINVFAPADGSLIGTVTNRP
jgi:DNA-directed RNA polymerase subunit RPC12/RpoP